MRAQRRSGQPARDNRPHGRVLSFSFFFFSEIYTNSRGQVKACFERSRSISHKIEDYIASPHCTSTCRIATSLMTVSSGTGPEYYDGDRNEPRYASAVVHGTLLLFSRPVYPLCTRRPSLARSFTSFRLSLLHSRPLSRISFSVPLVVVPPRTLSRSITVTPCHSCGCCFSLSHVLFLRSTAS